MTPSMPAAARGTPGNRRHIHIAVVFIGGAVGTLIRAAFSQAFPAPATAWPWATFGVNIVAAFVLGYAATRLPNPHHHRSLIGTGFCGGLSTFSVVQVELLQMIDAGAWGLLAGYVVASVVVGYGAIVVASRLARANR